MAALLHGAKLALLLSSAVLLPDYDSSAPLGQPHACLGQEHTCGTNQAQTDQQRHLQAWDRLLVWDSVYYSHIACHGHDIEQLYAFFPLMPGELSDLGK